MLMPSHAKNVKLYADTQPLLSRYGVENQLDGMFSPVVQLRSGGYIVLNQAEALVAIDVNSGRATREHHIEDTALKTNLEAADEIARQLRLRDLAGLIVIDFIDMDEKRNNRSVERRLKECLKQDRARIQVGRISHFGLLEMSRQRIRTSVLESSTEKCPYCGGSGHVRSVSSLALQVLRALEEQLMKGATHNLIARTRPDVALYVLNQKRAHLRALEERFAITITVSADDDAGRAAGVRDRSRRAGAHARKPPKRSRSRPRRRARAARGRRRPRRSRRVRDERGKRSRSEAAGRCRGSRTKLAAAAPTAAPTRPQRRRRSGTHGRSIGDESAGPRPSTLTTTTAETRRNRRRSRGGEGPADELAAERRRSCRPNRRRAQRDGERRRRRARPARRPAQSRSERERDGTPGASDRDMHEPSTSDDSCPAARAARMNLRRPTS